MSSLGGSPSEWWNVIKEPKYWFSMETPHTIANKEEDMERQKAEDDRKRLEMGKASKQATQNIIDKSLSDDENQRRRAAASMSQVLLANPQDRLSSSMVNKKTLLGA